MARVLGLIFSGHGSSMCLVEDGSIKRAINAERLTRDKFSLVGLPNHRDFFMSRRYNVAEDASQQSFHNFFEVFPRMLEYTTGAPTIEAAELDLVVKTPDNIKPIWGEDDARYQRFLKMFEGTQTCFELEHHLCHAYQAFLTSPFEEAAILTIDGSGEYLDRRKGGAICASLGRNHGVDVNIYKEVPVMSSLGGLYASHTRHLGFNAEQEGNTMALAAFGNEDYWERLKDIPALRVDGNFQLKWNTREQKPEWMVQMEAWCPPRQKNEPFEQHHMDMAWGVQHLTEECMLNAARGLVQRTGLKQLAVAGGVALNCVANARILAETPIEQIHVMPNAGDKGLAAGAALYGYHVVLGHQERHPPRHDYHGKSYTDDEIRIAIEQADGVTSRHSGDISSEAAALLAEGRIIGWVQGGSEYGPRALGHRSILADPRTQASKERLDQEIKRREWFRPYSPSVLAECADEYFEMNGPSPYMLQAVMARPEKRAEIAGVVHIDGTARVQTVEQGVEPRYYRLISEFRRRTGVPVVLNTSLNGYGEPMVETPDDAIATLKSMGLDALAIGDWLVWRSD